METWAGDVGTLEVREVSRVVGEKLNALEENDVSCSYGGEDGGGVRYRWKN